MFTLLHLLSPSWKEYCPEMAMSKVLTETQKLCELFMQKVFDANTGFGTNKMCGLFPNIHTEGFHLCL